MILRPDEKQITQEREYAEAQSQLNRDHELRVLDKTLEIEKYRVKRETLILKDLINLPFKILLILPLSIALIRKRVPEKLWELL